MNRSRSSLGCCLQSACFLLCLFSALTLPAQAMQNTAQFDELIAKAQVARLDKNYEEALELLRHAQHLIHREEGVLSSRQNPILEQMAVVHLARGSFAEANKMMEMQHRIITHESNESPEAMAPSWQMLGQWYQRTLQPRKSQKAFAKALEIMRGFALPRGEVANVQLAMLKNEYLLVGCCDFDAALASLEGLELNSEQWLALGDLALLAGEQRRAMGYYKNSGASVPATQIGVGRIDHMARSYVSATLERRSRMSIVTSAEMTPTQLVGAPLPLCESRLADIAGQDDYSSFAMDLDFVVTTHGEVKKVKVSNNTAPRLVRTLVREQLTSVTYRPELVAGEARPVKLSVSQQFDRLAEQGPAEQRSATQLGCLAAARALEQDLFVVGVH